MTTLQESSWVAVPDLTSQQALALEALGTVLIAGQPASDSETEQAPSLVQCRKTTSGSWQVRVNEAIGVIGCEGRTWVVRPKIGMPHLLHLMSMAGVLPRGTSVPVNLAYGDDFWRLLYGWLLDQVARLVRRDLLKGYVATQERLPYVRGTVDQLQLARGLMRGSTALLCSYEEFNADIAQNRLLKSALLMGLRAGVLDAATALRTRRLLARFEAVGEASKADLEVSVSRETQSYSEAVQLAKHLLRALHRELAEGSEQAWCFLWSTPNAVEAGLREVIRSELADLSKVTKGHVSHGELTFQPDLVIGSVGVGDVKYSLDTGGWRRSDVNQLLAFAAAFGVEDALLVNFSESALPPRPATVRTFSLTRLAWNVGATVPSAEKELRDQVRHWLTTSTARLGPPKLVSADA